MSLNADDGRYDRIRIAPAYNITIITLSRADTYGVRVLGDEAIECLYRLAARMARPKSSVVATSALYGRLSIVLVRTNARAILARSSAVY